MEILGARAKVFFKVLKTSLVLIFPFVLRQGKTNSNVDEKIQWYLDNYKFKDVKIFKYDTCLILEAKQPEKHMPFVYIIYSTSNCHHATAIRGSIYEFSKEPSDSLKSKIFGSFSPIYDYYVEDNKKYWWSDTKLSLKLLLYLAAAEIYEIAKHLKESDHDPTQL